MLHFNINKSSTHSFRETRYTNKATTEKLSSLYDTFYAAKDYIWKKMCLIFIDTRQEEEIFLPVQMGLKVWARLECSNKWNASLVMWDRRQMSDDGEGKDKKPDLFLCVRRGNRMSSFWEALLKMILAKQQLCFSHCRLARSWMNLWIWIWMSLQNHASFSICLTHSKYSFTGFD